MPLVSAEFIYQLKNYGFVLLIGAIGATPLPKKLAEKFLPKNSTGDILETAFLIVLLVISTAFLADGSFNPFLYFRF